MLPSATGKQLNRSGNSNGCVRLAIKALGDASNMHLPGEYISLLF